MQISTHEKRNARMYKDTLLYDTTLSEKDIKETDKVVSAGISLEPITSIDVIKDKYNAEVYTKDGKHFYNFWEISDSKLDPVFLKVYRDSSKLGKRFAKELNCWTYVVKGFADNPFADSLKMKIFEELDNDLKQQSGSA